MQFLLNRACIAKNTSIFFASWPKNTNNCFLQNCNAISPTFLSPVKSQWTRCNGSCGFCHLKRATFRRQEPYSTFQRKQRRMTMRSSLLINHFWVKWYIFLQAYTSAKCHAHIMNGQEWNTSYKFYSYVTYIL